MNLPLCNESVMFMERYSEIDSGSRKILSCPRSTLPADFEEVKH
jgi:hypothetical protein